MYARSESGKKWEKNHGRKKSAIRALSGTEIASLRELANAIQFVCGRIIKGNVLQNRVIYSNAKGGNESLNQRKCAYNEMDMPKKKNISPFLFFKMEFKWCATACGGFFLDFLPLILLLPIFDHTRHKCV